MDDKIIESFMTSSEEKLGKDEFAKISDEIGIIVTKNAETQKQLQSQADEIARLKRDKETLVIANGNLLKQVPVHTDTREKEADDFEDAKQPEISVRDAFDENGNFIN